MRLGFAGASFTPYSISADSQRTVNLFPEIVESGRGKGKVTLYGTAGLATLVQPTSANMIKALFYDTTTKRRFAVTRRTDGSVRLIEFTAAGVETDRGQLAASGGTTVPASISSNGSQLLIINPETTETAHILTLATNVLTNETADVAAGEPVWGQFLDQYFIALGRNGKIYLSALLDGLTWDPLDVATPESSPDTSTMILAANGQLYIWGPESMEAWVNTGAVDFPFEPLRHATQQQGLLLTYSVAFVNGQVVWVTRGRDGKGMVAATHAYGPNRISNHAVEQSIHNKVITGAVPVAFVEERHGHPFYILTFPDDSLTWAYDFSLPPEFGWHERMYLNDQTGAEESHLGRCATFAGGEDGAAGQILVGSRNEGLIFEMKIDTFTDRGAPIRRLRRAQHISEEMRQAVYDRLELDREPVSAVATYNLSISDDGGKNFSNQIAFTVAAETKEVVQAAVVAGGTGYAVGDVLTVSGGTGTAATLKVLAVSGGVITSVEVETNGAYSAAPANPVSVTGGTGSGATFNLELASDSINPDWRRLGAGRDRIFEIYSDSAVRHAWMDAYLDARPGVH